MNHVNRDMNDLGPLHLGKVLVILGIALVAMGLVVMASSKVSFLGFGRLPGDISYKNKNVAFYFPIVSCLIISAVLTLFFWLISLFTRR